MLEVVPFQWDCSLVNEALITHRGESTGLPFWKKIYLFLREAMTQWENYTFSQQIEPGVAELDFLQYL